MCFGNLIDIYKSNFIAFFFTAKNNMLLLNKYFIYLGIRLLNKFFICCFVFMSTATFSLEVAAIVAHYAIVLLQ